MTKKKKRENSEIEGAEFGVDSRYSSKKASKSEAEALMAARLERMKDLSEAEVQSARLLQFKIQMEDYLNKPQYDAEFSFSNCLRMYVDAIYNKRQNFAIDMGIKPTMLSQVINNHREPKQEFILRLMLHSEKTYEHICKFQQRTWLQVFYKEKLGIIMSNKDKWRRDIEKQITNSRLLQK